MNIIDQQHFNFLYEQLLIHSKLQGKRPATIDVYSRAIRRITTYDLKQYFNDLTWSTKFTLPS